MLCDVWGVVHNGVAATPPACEALTRFREQGGTVVLITNAPRPGRRRCASSSTSSACRATPTTASSVGRRDARRGGSSAPGRRCFLIGPERDLPIFDGLDAPFGALEQADYVVCTGPVRRRGRNAGRLPRDASRNCARATCSCCAPIPTWWSSAATSSSIAPARSPTATRRSAARSITPASRTGRSTIWRSRDRAGACGAHCGDAARTACWRSAIRCAPI